MNKALENGILDLTSIEQRVIEMERNRYLDAHCYKIYEGKDGLWHTYLPGRKHIRRRTRKEVEDVVVSYYMNEVGPTIKDIFKEWNDRKLSLKKIKGSTHLRNEQIFNRFFDKFGDRKIKDVSEEDICEFLEEKVCEFELSIRAYSNLKSILRGILKYARKKKLISISIEDAFTDIDISDRDFKIKIADDSKEIFYDDEINKVIKYCYEHKDDLCCLGVALMFGSGLRVGEAVALKFLDISGDLIRVTKTESRYKEGNSCKFIVSDYPKTPAGIRTVVLPEKYLWVTKAIETFGSGDGYIFTGKTKERLHTQAIRKRLYQICEKLDIPVRSPHKIRKTYGSILLDNGINSKVIEKQMGHSSISCTETYYHKDRMLIDDKRAAINSIKQFS